MSYIGNTVENQNYVPAIDYFNGNGSTTAFTLSRPVASVAAVQAVISNVPQNPGSAFTVSGSTITFTSAPPSGTNNIYVYYTSPNTQVVQPGQGTVGATQIDGNYALWNKSGSDINYTAGNVGIGTSSPSVKLDIVGEAKVSNGTYGTYLTYSNGNQTGIIGTYGNHGLEFRTNNIERMRIDSSGRVTLPYQPAFCIRGSGSGGWSSTSGVIVWNGSVQSNIGSNYSTSTGRFTAPVSGTYHFDAMFYVGSQASSNAVFRLRVNGTSLEYIETYNTATMVSISINTSIYLNANDYVDIYADSPSGRQWYTGNNESNFSGYLIG